MAEISDESLAQLSADERSDLMRPLQALTAQDYHPSREVVLLRRWFLRFLAACCVLLVPWIVAWRSNCLGST